MPRISDQILRSIVYLYPSEAEAWAGERAGGSGFVAWIEGEDEAGHYYVVTASHVVREGGSPVARFNTPDDRTHVLPFPADAWFHHPDGDDVAIAVLPAEEFYRLGLTGVPPMLFVDPELMERENLGPGDECFFVGRFMAHDGGVERNFPSVRFGNLATPLTRIPHDRGFDQESFLVESRSLSGYSGSPVFIYSAAVVSLNATEMQTIATSQIFLLGLDWSHLNDYEPVLGGDKKTPVEPKEFVKRNAGMMGVVPAWKICELLCDEEMMELRRETEKPVRPSVASLDVEHAEESEYDRFQALATKLVNTPKPESDEEA